MCISGVDLYDNTLTRAAVASLGCGGNCRVELSACTCAPAVDPLTFDITETPWYCDDDPASEEFLGLFLIRLDGHDSRPWQRQAYDSTSCPDGQCGGSLSTLRTGMRTLTFSVLGVALSCAGAAYGKRFLQDRLEGSCTKRSCDYDIQLSDCCQVAGAPERTWTGRTAGITSPVSFENLCDCTVFRATFQIALSPYFFDCSADPCLISAPPSCGSGVECIDVDDWATKFGLQGSCKTCGSASCGGFERTCADKFIAGILDNSCDFTSNRATDCCVPVEPCSFVPPKPKSRSRSCQICMPVTVSDWSAPCVVEATSDELVFDIEVVAGVTDVFGVHVAAFDADPTTTPGLTPVWEWMIPRMHGGGEAKRDGISCAATYNCGTGPTPAERMSAEDGASILTCGTYYFATRFDCSQPLPAGFSVNVKPIVRRASL